MEVTKVPLVFLVKLLMVEDTLLQENPT